MASSGIGNGARLTVLAGSENEAVAAALRRFVAMTQLPESMRPFKSITAVHCNDAPAAASPLAPALASLGFRRDVNQTLRYDGYV